MSDSLEHSAIRCGAVWGGIRNHDTQLDAAAVRAALYSRAYRDADEGGDIYYLSVCDGDVITRFAVADVRGHGEAVRNISSALAESMRHEMNSEDGRTVMRHLNAAAQQFGVTGMTTAAVVSYSRDSRRLSFCYAGHHPILLQRGADAAWGPACLDERADPPRNLPLAVLDDVRYDQTELELQRGDRFLLYTDGVIETPNAADEEFGAERLLSVLEASRGETLESLKRSVVTALTDHRGGPLDHDDVTLMAIEIAG